MQDTDILTGLNTTAANPDNTQGHFILNKYSVYPFGPVVSVITELPETCEINEQKRSKK